jgi:hypothetical protein
MRDLPIDLYPGAPPSVQIRGNPATDPLNRGISQHILYRHKIETVTAPFWTVTVDIALDSLRTHTGTQTRN